MEKVVSALQSGVSNPKHVTPAKDDRLVFHVSPAHSHAVCRPSSSRTSICIIHLRSSEIANTPLEDPSGMPMTPAECVLTTDQLFVPDRV